MTNEELQRLINDVSNSVFTDNKSLFEDSFRDALRHQPEIASSFNEEQLQFLLHIYIAAISNASKSGVVSTLQVLQDLGKL